MTELHIAAAQIHSGGTITETLQRLERQVHAAAAVDVDVILFSECVLHGYDYGLTHERLETLAEPVNGSTCNQVLTLAKQYDINILAGFFEHKEGNFYNSHLVARPNGERDVERKHELTEGERSAGITAGDSTRKVLTFKDVRTSIIICADNGIERLHEHLEDQNVDYRFCPTGGGGDISDMLHESDLETDEGRSAYERNRPCVFKSAAFLDNDECPESGFTSANALGPVGDNTCHQGHCMIVDQNCVMRAQIPGTNVLEHQQDQMVHAKLNFD